MKILAITAHHPPYHSGGYELRVKNILDGLAERGHTIWVLTNKPERQAGKRAETSSYPVIRKLHNRYNARFFPREVLYDLRDTALLEKQIAKFEPDVIYIGHLYILSKALLPYLARLDVPILYDEGGSGLIDAWQEHGRWFRFTGDWHSSFAPLNWLRPLVIWLVCWLSNGRIQRDWSWPQRMRIVFNSRLNQTNAANTGVPIGNSIVLHSGVNTDLFGFQPREGFHKPLRIIVPGRLERRKGQLDAVKLLKELLAVGIDTSLTLAGSGWTDGYAEEVSKYIEENGLWDKVGILPMLNQSQLVEEYHQADICFFPSYQSIGFSRTPLEAMACGSLVITYGNEGSDEIVRNGENGYIVSPGEINKIMNIVLDLQSNPQVITSITSQAIRDIGNQFTIESYIHQIEQELRLHPSK